MTRYVNSDSTFAKYVKFSLDLICNKCAIMYSLFLNRTSKIFVGEYLGKVYSGHEAMFQ